MKHKCARIGCNGYGKYQPLIRLRASILPANGNDILAVVRPKMTVCLTHRLESRTADIIAVIRPDEMKKLIQQAKDKTGASPNPDRTDVLWVRIHGQRTDG